MKNSIKKLAQFCIPVFSLALIVSCSEIKKEQDSDTFIKNKEAREDSMKLAEAYQLQSKVKFHLQATVETEPVQEDPNADAADDPAIWFNSAMPDSSMVFGTNKKSGVHAYALDGRELAFYRLGRVNNIDTRQGAVIGTDTLDLLGGSNRTDNSVIVHKIDVQGKLVPLLAQNFVIDTAQIDEVYGFSMYKDLANVPYVIVNGKNGVIHQYQIVAAGEKYDLKLVNQWALNSQPEGMVADDELAILYAGEEQRGIWKILLNDASVAPALISGSQKENNPGIEYDIEGLSIYYGDKGNGFLLASIQGSFSYAMFDRQTNDYFGNFSIETGDIDGVEETDGLDIYSRPIGEKFPQGMLVVQDGFNDDNGQMVGQNFKYVPLQKVLALFEK